jgi:hypothetical protein
MTQFSFGQIRNPSEITDPPKWQRPENSYVQGAVCDQPSAQKMVRSENEHGEKNREIGRSWERVQAGTLPCLGISIFDVSGNSPYSILVSLMLV